jgi:hypothetical protein
MAASAFVIRVPEAEACVGALRERFDASVKLGVPAHITVLVPFMPPERITDAVLERAHAALIEVPAFCFDLVEIRRFPNTTYLSPQPPEPFVALTESLVRNFPSYPPFGGEFEAIIPHLTVAHGNAAEVEVAAVELAAIIRTHGRIASSCASVALLENSSGHWRQMHVFNLPARTNDA